MREVIAVCRSSKKSRERTARVLDRYFWRIGDRTWRGKATNACLDRMSRELRRGAARNTAVTIYEIRSAHESRVPLIRIGSRVAFSDEGLVPIASHPAAVYRIGSRSETESCAAALVRVAALFHDLGKATELFQEKLRRSLKEASPRRTRSATNYIRQRSGIGCLASALTTNSETHSLHWCLGKSTMPARGLSDTCKGCTLHCRIPAPETKSASPFLHPGVKDLSRIWSGCLS